MIPIQAKSSTHLNLMSQSVPPSADPNSLLGNILWNWQKTGSLNIQQDKNKTTARLPIANKKKQKH